MAEAAALPVNKTMVVSAVVAIVIVFIAVFLYHKFWGKPEGALTQAEYDALTAEQKALYKKSGDYWVKA